MPETPTPRAIADKLKSMLYPPRPGETADYASLVAHFNKLCSSGPHGTPDTIRAQNEMANHLLVLAESKQDKSLIKAALQGLLGSGRLGRQAVCRFLRSGSISLEQLAPMVAGLPVRLRLHLLQELLRRIKEEDKGLMQWAKQQLLPLEEAPAQDILVFLEECCLAGDAPIHPVRQIIIRGRFPDWLDNKLKSQPSGTEFSSFCRATHALNWHKTTNMLANALFDGRIPPDAEDVRLLATAGNLSSPLLAKCFQKLLASKDDTIALIGVEGLSRIAWPKTGKAFALLHKRFPGLRHRLAIKAAILPHAALMDFLRLISAQDREEMVAHIFTALARLDPEFALERIDQTQSLQQSASNTLKAFVAAQMKEARGGLKRRAMPPDPGGPAGLQKKGLMKRLFSEKKQTLAEVLDMVHSPMEKDLPGSEFSGTLTSRNLSKLTLPGSYFLKAQFIKVTFSAVDFSDCGFNEVDFTGCTFNNCVFSRAIFLSSVFASCQFKNCEFTAAAFKNCSFEDGHIDRSFFSGALMHDCAVSLMSLRYTSFNICQFQESSLSSCRMKFTALAHSQFLDCSFAGTELLDCALTHALFVGTDVLSSSFARTTLESCSMMNSSSDVGSFQRARHADLLQKAAALEMRDLDPPAAAWENSSALLPMVDLFSRRTEINRRHAPLLLNNQRRLEHSSRRMAGEDCFWLVPYLLQSDIIDQKFKIAAAPPCRIEGYTPSYTALTSTQKYFKDFSPMAPKSKPILIEGLYAMGSIGSVAQTRSSDVDYWVCYDATTATPQSLQGLRAKLDAITDWAMETFELEAYFFLMSMDDVRANEFGFSDKESSGSAQAILLKEEFYRTIVPVAGLHPSWWVTPPGVSEKAYRAWLTAAKTLPRPTASKFVDMGHLSPIPQDEYFGASLWQIVKALHSPYKSVMKLGLLEKYSDQPQSLMLADQIKRDVVQGQADIPWIDPYVVLFRELRDYYRTQGDKETVLLLTEALLLKAKVGEFDFFFDFPSVFEEQSLLDFLFGSGKATEDKVRSLGKTWSFSKSLKIGSTVSHFMTATYKRIQSKLGRGTQARITPEDLTRLGRQIAANFARKKHKILRVPFLGTKGYSELRFSAEKAPGKQTAWAVQGRTRAEGKKSVKDAELLHRASDPITLLAWLVMNRLFTSKTLVDGESSIAPMSVVDIKNGLEQLHAFFPYDDTFELEPDDYLGDELVTRVMLLVNLAQPPEAGKIYHVDVVYATSHGEVFSVPISKPDASIMKSVRAWLSNILPQDTSRISEIQIVYPKRGQCPRIPGA